MSTRSAGCATENGVLDRVLRGCSPGDFATLDADETLWQNDLAHALLAHLDAEGVLSLERLDPALRTEAPIPGESLYGYARRVPERNGDDYCHRWMARVFAGLGLGAVKRHVDAMMARAEPIPYSHQSQGRIVIGNVRPPVIYPLQRRLVNRLLRANLTVCVVTGALAELARMLLSDPRYGFGLPRGQVHGARVRLIEGLVPSGERVASGGTDTFFTGEIQEPVTWYGGKLTTIRQRISPAVRPVLAAGDSPSDWDMLFHADGARGVRVWVDRDEKATAALHEERQRRAHRAETRGTDPAEVLSGWTHLTPDDLLT